MITVDSIREHLATGRGRELVGELAALESSERRSICKPLVSQARAILSTSTGSTVTSWLKDLRDDYPGGREQFVDAWVGRVTVAHWDAATAVLLGAKVPAQAAKVWPIPADSSFANWVYPTLFPSDLDVFVEQWSADFASNPKHWDRNLGRAVMFDWVEGGLVASPRHDGAVLMLIGGCAAMPGEPLLQWLLARPKVTADVFARIFTAHGVKGASLAQSDEGSVGHPLRTVVVPGLVTEGVWSRDFVVHSTEAALRSDLPAYQRRWFVRLADDLGL